MTESFDLSVPWSEALLKTRVNDLEQQLEIERMRLAACGVVALANTPESAANAREMLPQYRSASCDDVARLVDSEMALRQQLADARRTAEYWKANHLAGNEQLAACERQRDTAWAQAHRLALELECLLLDTKDNAVVSKWWDSGMEALSEYQELQPGAKEDAEAWAAMRKAGI